MNVIDQTGRFKLPRIGGYRPYEWLGVLSAAGLVLIVEWQLWSTLIRRKKTADLWVFFGVHLAFLLGIAVAVLRENTIQTTLKSMHLTRSPASPAGAGFFALDLARRTPVCSSWCASWP